MRNRRRYAMVAVARRNGAAMWVKRETESKYSCDGADDCFLTNKLFQTCNQHGPRLARATRKSANDHRRLKHQSIS